MKTPLPKFPHHRGVPEHHFGVKTPLLATLSVTNKFASKCATIWPKCAQKCATEEFGQNVLKNAPQKKFFDPPVHFNCIFMHHFFRCQIFLKKRFSS